VFPLMTHAKTIVSLLYVMLDGALAEVAIVGIIRLTNNSAAGYC